MCPNLLWGWGLLILFLWSFFVGAAFLQLIKPSCFLWLKKLYRPFATCGVLQPVFGSVTNPLFPCVLTHHCPHSFPKVPLYMSQRRQTSSQLPHMWGHSTTAWGWTDQKGASASKVSWVSQCYTQLFEDSSLWNSIHLWTPSEGFHSQVCYKIGDSPHTIAEGLGFFPPLPGFLDHTLLILRG